MENNSLYNDTYTTQTTVDDATVAAITGLFFFIYILIAIASYVITAIFLGKIFKKAGLASWPAWVPIYNFWKALEIGGQQGFWSILSVVPYVNIVSAVFMYISMYHIGLKLGKSGAFVVLGIFLPIVWVIWLAVDKSVWNDSLGKRSLATGPVPNPNPNA
jgi:hypothetical protein